jgi:hypothetical protein
MGRIAPIVEAQREFEDLVARREKDGALFTATPDRRISNDRRIMGVFGTRRLEGDFDRRVDTSWTYRLPNGVHPSRRDYIGGKFPVRRQLKYGRRKVGDRRSTATQCGPKACPVIPQSSWLCKSCLAEVPNHSKHICGDNYTKLSDSERRPAVDLTVKTGLAEKEEAWQRMLSAIHFGRRNGKDRRAGK